MKCFQPANDEMPPGHVLEMADKRVLTSAPPAAPITGTACAAAFSETAMPKREAMTDISRTNAGSTGLAEAFLREKLRCFADGIWRARRVQ